MAGTVAGQDGQSWSPKAGGIGFHVVAGLSRHATAVAAGADASSPGAPAASSATCSTV